MSGLALAIPLQGVQLIEASAGTGKTFTVATLYARLVIEAGLPVSSVLAVTYTVAATKELRDRLRARLQLALRLAEGADDDSAEAAALLAPVAQAREREGTVALVRRLREAVAQMDLAPIHTIHAFCQRALAEHAVEAGLAPLRRELVANERSLRNEAATAFWRAQSREVEATRALECWSGPAHLADTLRDALAADELSPPLPAPVDAAVDDELAKACVALAEAFRLHGAAARAALEQAMAAGALNKQRFRDSKLEEVWLSLDNWSRTDLDPALPHADLSWFGTREIAAKLTAKAKAPAPASPLFDAIEAFVDAREACAERERRLRLELLHRLREDGRARLDAIKRERRLQGFDDLVDALDRALHGAGGEAFAARLRERYRAALVDEFQDTDARQDAIFRRLFADRALFLVGDPKQAIYRFRGGDVLAYLRARQGAEAHALHRNFRSRPRLLAALQALFEHAGERAFAWDGIGFQPVEAGGRVRDDDFQRDGAPAPGLVVLRLRDIAGQPIARVRELAAQACAAEILALLQHGQRRDAHGALRRVAPGDIAILIERNDDAPPMREALARLGIPCVARGRESLYRSAEADELRRLLRALRRPGDEARMRGALATLLLGLDAAQLDALARDEPARRAWHDRFQAWRERSERHGVLGVIAEACADSAARLLALADGERRLGNYLQLAEALQEGAPAADLERVLDEFERRIEAADPDNEEELPRLESDADRVAILTLHKAKGLEWDFVFLPFVATHGAAGRARVPKRVRVHEAGKQVLHFLDHDAALDAAMTPREHAEERAERVRLAYVGLTRARLATWCCWGAARDAERTPLAWLLHREGEVVPRLDEARIDADLARWQARAPEAIAIVDTATPAPGRRYRPVDNEPVPPARVAERVLTRDWWVYSYSMLANEPRNEVAHIEERGADDETEAAPLPVVADTPRFAGVRFGNSLHAALEHVDAERWLHWRGGEPPEGQRAALEAALGAQGFARADDLDEGVALLARLVGDTLNARLPEGICLAQIPRAARRDELEFHLGLAPVALDRLLALLHAHGIARARQGFGLRRRIEGLLTGRIDVVYESGGRVFVLDYKSNRLPDYSSAGVEQAIAHGEYDLQYVLYTLAVHRWLRFRRPGYDYARDFGGVRYLFCRGLSEPGHGIHAVTPSFELIDALDRLFAGGAP